MNDFGLVVAYSRLSQDDANKENEYSSSIYNQLGFINSYAKQMGLEINKEYIDDGYSGTNFDRPGFEQLREDIEDGLVKVLITKDMSRLGRNFLETAYYVTEFFPKNNVRYIAINDGFDSADENNTHQEIMLEFKSLINDKYAKDVSVKRKQVAEQKTNEGQFIGFKAPYGYKIKKVGNNRTLEIDEEAAVIVRRIFNEILSGKSRQEVANGLNNDKITPPVLYLKMTPSKKKKYYYDWDNKIIYRILKNKTYTGRIVKRSSTKYDYHSKKREWIPLRDRETIDNCHPAIINDELFYGANAKVKTLRRKVKNNYSGLFKDLVICGTCGRTMTPCRKINDQGNEKYFFDCTAVIERKPCNNRTIADSKLKIIVSSALKDIIDTYVDGKDITNQLTKKMLRSERPNVKIDNLKKDIEFHNKNIRTLYLDKTSGKISLDEFIIKKDNELLLKEQSETELKNIMNSKNADIRKQELLEKYDKFINGNEFINDIIREFIEKIVVYKDNTLIISFKFGLGNPKKIQLF
mgnify:CR=1 FL=1